MKKIYVKPKTEVFKLNNESALCAGTGVGAQITSDKYENVSDLPVKEEGDDNWEPAITAKGGDFFEESVNPSSIWGDED